ncbi:MAG: Ig domain-containing protein, partial [Terracidiphilus sp.]
MALWPTYNLLPCFIAQSHPWSIYFAYWRRGATQSPTRATFSVARACAACIYLGFASTAWHGPSKVLFFLFNKGAISAMHLLRIRWVRVLSYLVSLLALSSAAVLSGCGAMTPAAVVAPPPLTILASALPNGNVGQAYSTTLTASGGKAPYAWALSGALPGGLTLTSSTGIICGTPTSSAHAVPLNIRVSDSSSPARSTSVTLHLTISAPPPSLVISISAPPNGNIGTAYSATASASGGTPPYAWTLNGSLPSGLALNPATGVISGTPTSAANALPIIVTATDSSNPERTGSATLNMTIYATVAVSTKET